MATLRWLLSLTVQASHPGPRQEENSQVPGSYEGTLTSEGRLPSAFPPLRA